MNPGMTYFWHQPCFTDESWDDLLLASALFERWTLWWPTFGISLVWDMNPGMTYFYHQPCLIDVSWDDLLLASALFDRWILGWPTFGISPVWDTCSEMTYFWQWPRRRPPPLLSSWQDSCRTFPQWDLQTIIKCWQKRSRSPETENIFPVFRNSIKTSGQKSKLALPSTLMCLSPRPKRGTLGLQTWNVVTVDPGRGDRLLENLRSVAALLRQTLLHFVDVHVCNSLSETWQSDPPPRPHTARSSAAQGEK